MNKYRFTIVTLLLVLFNIKSAYAVNPQIDLGYNYLKDINNVLNEKLNITESSTSLDINNIINKSNQYFGKENEWILIYDITKSNKKENKFVGLLQEKWGMPVTGIFDNDFFERLKKEQELKGLNINGVLDPITWYALYEMPVAWKLKTVNQSIINWQNIINKNKDNKSNMMVVVNIPSMKLVLWEKKLKNNNEFEYSKILESPVVVGKPKTQTPIEDFEIWGLKYNPNWTPTHNILRRNIVKKSGIDKKWIDSHNLKIFNANGESIDSEEFVANIESGDDFSSYRFTQPSGDGNALGVLKFETTSKQNIYLHDTNERILFTHNTRLYSSGCIRVKNFMELAAAISGENVEYVQNSINKRKMYTDNFNVNIPVYIDYSQAEFLPNGIRFYPNIYSK